MQVFKSKMITIVAFWALTGLLVLSLPLSAQDFKKTISDNHISEQKLTLVPSENLQNL